jgi:hypothetical protein
VHSRTKLLSILWKEDTLPRGHRDSVRTGTGRRELVEFCDLKKNPLRDFHRVVEHPADLARGCLSRRVARRASKHSPSTGEGKKGKNPLGV